MIIALEERKRLDQVFAVLKKDRLPFWNLWRDLANYFLPKRYVWLESTNEARVRRTARNPMIIDSTGTAAARILASGMFNGVTSPSRPWFSLRIPGYDDEGGPVTQWLEACTLVMMQVMAESNFYNALAVMYLDLVVFGTAAALIYEDDETVIRCYNPALGEFYLGQSHRLAIDTFAREFNQSVRQLATQFGEENLTDQSKANLRRGGAEALSEVKVYHLIEPNHNNSGVPLKFRYRETYWEASSTGGVVLAMRGFNELPGIFPRWEQTANDAYGTSPAMDALGDVIQLQQESKRKAQGLDKMINPPIVADIQLQHRPTALLPNGITYVAGQNNVGAKPLYQIAAPIQEISDDIGNIQIRIREIFHNSLFNMISQLDTVRSATEIDARKEEKLVLLGSVLERFENEALDPSIDRIFKICLRKRLFPDPPQELPEGTPIEPQYVSILATIQRSLKAAPTERWVGLIGNLAGVVPQALSVPKWDELIRDYGLAIGVPAKVMKTREEVQAEVEAQQAQQEAAASAETANQLAQGAQTLSETEVGGGANALQQLLAG